MDITETYSYSVETSSCLFVQNLCISVTIQGCEYELSDVKSARNYGL